MPSSLLVNHSAWYSVELICIHCLPPTPPTLSPWCTVWLQVVQHDMQYCCAGLQETIEWLARPENYDPDRTPPGLEDFDPVPFLLSSLPITASVMATQFAHELGHRVIAFRKKVCCDTIKFLSPQAVTTSCHLLSVHSVFVKELFVNTEQ